MTRIWMDAEGFLPIAENFTARPAAKLPDPQHRSLEMRVLEKYYLLNAPLLSILQLMVRRATLLNDEIRETLAHDTARIVLSQQANPRASAHASSDD